MVGFGVDIQQAVDNNKSAVAWLGVDNIVIVDLWAPAAVEVAAALVAVRLVVGPVVESVIGPAVEPVVKSVVEWVFQMKVRLMEVPCHQ